MDDLGAGDGDAGERDAAQSAEFRDERGLADPHRQPRGLCAAPWLDRARHGVFLRDGFLRWRGLDAFGEAYDPRP